MLGDVAFPIVPEEDEDEEAEEEERLGARTDCGRTLVELKTGCAAGLDWLLRIQGEGSLYSVTFQALTSRI